MQYSYTKAMIVLDKINKVLEVKIGSHKESEEKEGYYLEFIKNQLV